MSHRVHSILLSPDFETLQNLRVVKTPLSVNHGVASVTLAISGIFVALRVLGTKDLVLQGRMQTRHFRRFRQNPLFSAGGKTTVFQNHRFDYPENLMFKTEKIVPVHRVCFRKGF